MSFSGKHKIFASQTPMLKMSDKRNCEIFEKETFFKSFDKIYISLKNMTIFIYTHK